MSVNKKDINKPSRTSIMNKLKIVALAGGVGGAKLADGLAQVLEPDQLTIIVNTADDFTHLGLRISPDLDTVCYTLAGLANPDTGWGRIDETWNAFTQLKFMGMPDWFQLGDSDIATHLVRTIRYRDGWTLSQITQEFCRIWGITVRVLPMSDQDIQTLVNTDEGILDFQDYFVHRKCFPMVKGFNFKGIENSLPALNVMDALKDADAVVICPSNPWVSIDPILSIPEILPAIKEHLVIAVSPIIGKQTIKGPAAKMFSELGIEPSAFAVAQHYGSIIDSVVIDNSDSYLEERIHALGTKTYLTNIIMHDRPGRKRLANEILEYINGLLMVI
jgi:LPPG:FO 2-phospho-L-lactate transferase